MDRGRGLDALRPLRRRDGESHCRRRAARCQDISGSRSEHHRLVCARGGEMTSWKMLSTGLLLLTGATIAMPTRAAQIAQHIVRAKIGGIDLIAYPTAVKDVVTLIGSLPAGDAFAGAGNVAVPTLVGMMLERGTQ